MFDFNFNWDGRLALGIEQIDSQHQVFFQIGRHIEQLLLIQCIGVTEQELMNILYDLREYVTYHFYDEETFMKTIHYPHIMQHIAEHESFKNYINSIDYTALCASPYKELTHLRNAIVEWVFEHIVKQDKDIEAYYQQLSS